MGSHEPLLLSCGLWLLSRRASADPDAAKRKHDEVAEGVPRQLAHNKYMRVGARELERGQVVVHFGIQKHRLGCAMRFNYAGDEPALLQENLDTLKHGVCKLVVTGVPLVTDKMLHFVLETYPLISSLKIAAEDELCNQVTEATLTRTLSSPHLRSFRLEHCSSIGAVRFNSPSLESLALGGLSNECAEVSIKAPRLRRLVLQFFGGRERCASGLPEAIAGCAATLERLYVFCSALTIDEVRRIRFPEMKVLRELSLSLELNQELLDSPLSDVLDQLTVLEMWVSRFTQSFCDGLQKRCMNLKRLIVHGAGGMPHLAEFVSSHKQLEALTIEGSGATELAIRSSTLIELSVLNCMALSSLDLDCPNLKNFVVLNCPEMAAKKRRK